MDINILDGHAIRVITTATMILFLKFFTRKKIHDVTIIFAIIYLCIIFIQALWLFVISSFGLGINENHTFLLDQILTAVVVLYIERKIPLHKIYNKIKKEILIKLLIFSFAVILMLMLFYFNFNYTPSYILYFSLLVLVTFIGLCCTLKRVFSYTNKIRMQLHDIKNLLMGIYLNEYKKKSIDDFNKMFEEKYSTKEESYSRGYGLSNLSKVVANYGGKIFLKEEYNKEQKCDYLKIFIDI